MFLINKIVIACQQRNLWMFRAFPILWKCHSSQSSEDGGDATKPRQNVTYVTLPKADLNFHIVPNIAYPYLYCMEQSRKILEFCFI